MDGGDDGAERQLPGMEADKEVDRDQHERGQESDHCGIAQFGADLWSDHLEPADLYARIDRLQHGLDASAHDIRRLALGRRQPDRHIA